MSWRTNGLVLMMRNAGRVIGLNKWIASGLLGGGYEAKYDQQFSTRIQPGDCVWDVGANIGYYTLRYAELVGQEGKVFAFEPSPANFSRLAKQCATLNNITLLQCGLGKSDSKLYFQQGEDALGATSHVTLSHSSGIVVEMRSGDSLLASGTANIPQVIKMDVEGFEWEVLKGMATLLRQPSLRTIGIEVHFGILKERGMKKVPQQIEGFLRDFGFSLTWPDNSHVLAVRQRNAVRED